MSLVFNEDAHRYTLDGKPVSGVTSLIAQGTPKDALIWWSATVAGEWAAAHKSDLPTMADESIIEQARKEHLRRRDSAGIQGTEVHRLAEELHTHGEVSADDDLHASFIEGYADFLDAWEITPVLFERPGASREHWYAGTFDLLCRSPYLADGELVQIDLKTSKRVYGDTAMQAAAYCKNEFYVDTWGVEQPMPAVHATYVAHVTPMHREGEAAQRYREAPVGTSLYALSQTPRQIDRHFGWFLNAAATAKSKPLRERLIKAPLKVPH